MAESTINIIKIQDTVGDNHKIGAETATKLQSSLSTSGTGNLYAVGTDGKSIVYFNNGIPVKSTVSLGNSSTPLYLDNGVLTTTTAIGNGQLSISPSADSHLTASGTFTANQSGNSSLTIGVSSGYAIPTSTQISNWDTAYGWGNHADAGYLDESDELVISNAINDLYDTKADSNHTHETSIATSADTSQISLAYDGKYSLNAGGTSYIFTMPPTPVDTKNTAGATDTNSKIYLIGATAQTANPQTYSNNDVFVDTDADFNAPTVTATNNRFNFNSNAYAEYNSTDKCINFIFN